MGQKMRFPTSPSGELFTGDNPVAAGGSEVVPAWNAALQEWEPKTITTGGGGDFTNITRLVYVDFATPVDPGDQNGNIETPFASLQDAIDDAGTLAGTCFMLAANLDGESYGSITVPADAFFAFKGLGGAPAFIDDLTMGANAHCIFRGQIQCGDVTLATGTWLEAYWDGQGTFGNIAGPEADETTTVWLAGNGTVNGPGGTAANIAAGAISLDGVAVGDLTCFTAAGSAASATRSSVANVTSEGGFSADLYTLARMRSNGATVTAPNGVDVLDAPAVGVTVGVNPVSPPEIVRVDVSVPGSEVGDSFIVSAVNTPSAIAAGMAVGEAWCDTPGTVTIPVVVISGGSSTFNAVVTRLTTGYIVP